MASTAPLMLRALSQRTALSARRVPALCAALPQRLQWPQIRSHGGITAKPGAEMVEFSFKLRDNSLKKVSVPEGTNILEAAHANEVDLEGACEASLACSTCHVILPEEIYDSLEEPTDTEEDLLDLCPCLTSSSRLGCQVIVDKRLQGKEVELPKATVNFYVDGHVPQPH